MKGRFSSGEGFLLVFVLFGKKMANLERNYSEADFRLIKELLNYYGYSKGGKGGEFPIQEKPKMVISEASHSRN